MTERKPTLCVVAGPNGSGKTTTTMQLLNNEWAADSLYINPDNIAQDTFGDWNSFDAVLKESCAISVLNKVGILCLKQFSLLLRNWSFLKKPKKHVFSFVSFMSARQIPPLM